MPRRYPILATDEIYHVFNRTISKEDILSSKINLRKILETIDFYRFPQKIKLSKFKTLPENLKRDYLITLRNQTPLVEMYVYAFLPNHYHLLLKQLQEKGIVKFTSNFQNSFAKYFNLKNNRDGSLFQNSFKAKRIETDEEFIHISRYIHLNPVTSFLIEFKDLSTYPWSSFPYYLEEKENLFIFAEKNEQSEFISPLRKPRPSTGEDEAGKKEAEPPRETPPFHGRRGFINTQFLMNRFKSKENFVKFVSDQVDYQRELALIKNSIIE